MWEGEGRGLDDWRKGSGRVRSSQHRTPGAVVVHARHARPARAAVVRAIRLEQHAAVAVAHRYTQSSIASDSRQSTLDSRYKSVYERWRRTAQELNCAAPLTRTGQKKERKERRGQQEGS